ncbi:MAG: hypothetical protein FWC68_03300 [Oscillospiraceae bacterium]|nr:hypothetical protein [Oscillospiraceae bacterium]
MYRLETLGRDNEADRIAREANARNEGVDQRGILNAIEVAASEERISPGATITIRRIYIDCGHTIQTTEVIDESLVNLNEEQFKTERPDLILNKFTPDEIIAHQEINDFCREHYRIRDVDGRLTVFELDRNGNEIRIFQTTNIWTSFLTETDLIYIGQGKNIYTRRELSRVLEDFDQ